jgi:hypothetical protein
MLKEMDSVPPPPSNSYDSSRKWWHFLKTPGYTRTLGVLAFFLLVAAVPLTVYVAQQRQDLQQGAAETQCPAGTSPQCIGYALANGTNATCYQGTTPVTDICLASCGTCTPSGTAATNTPVPPTATPGGTEPTAIPRGNSDAAHCAGSDYKRRINGADTGIMCQGWVSGNTSCQTDQENPYYYNSCSGPAAPTAIPRGNSDAAHCAGADYKRRINGVETGIVCQGWRSSNNSCSQDLENPYYYDSCGGGTSPTQPASSPTVGASPTAGSPTQPAATQCPAGTVGNPECIGYAIAGNKNATCYNAARQPIADVCATGCGTCTYTATTPPPGATTLALDLAMPNQGNTNPNTKTRNITVCLYGQSADPSQGDPVTCTGSAAKKIAQVVWDTATSRFKSTIDLGAVSAGSYQVFVKSEKYLRKRMPTILNVTTDTKNYTLPQATMVLGDTNNDNKIDIVDFNMVAFNCYDTKVTTSTCPVGLNADLNDDGKVDGIDISQMTLLFGLKNGD